MRKVNKFLGVYLCTLVLALVSVISFTSCDRFNGGVSKPSVDSVYIAQTVEASANPSFVSVPDILNFQSRLIEEYSIDATFRSLPESVITNVATVCLNKRPSVTKNDIITEYRANQSVYDNLNTEIKSDQATPQENNSTTVTEEQQTTAPLSTSYRYEVDTVNGQPVRVLVKEEKYESK